MAYPGEKRKTLDMEDQIDGTTPPAADPNAEYQRRGEHAGKYHNVEDSTPSPTTGPRRPTGPYEDKLKYGDEKQAPPPRKKNIFGF